ncbi:hypothetical protein [Sphingobacterium griseoflavum]|uniref:Lipoprotein n=1 Tax=Sphingobacterium griseoflavum TaxID=1474952 RepID=A0ABQ3HXC7_9SPHI|nr:hypothetical protein [Sphingobacterium griseoflavum]GHE43128.1 hypothetical protein GCM10017764_27920 [Sphingobacterium griseoflavum]
MKYMALLLVTLSLTACHGRKDNSKSSNTSNLAQLGGDKDDNGCLASAGYTWSKVRENCIRPWEEAITMNVTDTSTSFETAAFVLIDSTKHQAELFLKEEDESILLDSVSPLLYKNKQYTLAQENHCWSLIHQDEMLYEEKK